MELIKDLLILILPSLLTAVFSYLGIDKIKFQRKSTYCKLNEYKLRNPKEYKIRKPKEYKIRNPMVFGFMLSEKGVKL